MRGTLLTVFLCPIAFAAICGERMPLWPEGRIPDFQPHQYAAPSEDVQDPGFDRAKAAMPYLEWEEPVSAGRRSDVCVILISGGGYWCTCDRPAFRQLQWKLQQAGVTCVWLWYRVPHPKGLPIYQSAWEDGQRAARLVRAAARERGFDPEKIGVLGCSAGSHLSVMLATSALTPAYARVDATDDIPCHVNFAVPMCTAYALTDGLSGKNMRAGDAPDVTLNPSFRFDAKTAPMCLFHGGEDPYSPNGSTQLYRQLRRMGVPAELHLDPDRGHGPVDAPTFERAIEFLHDIGMLGTGKPEEEIMTRYGDDTARASCERKPVWSEGKMPDVQTNQCVPYLEWHLPKHLKTRAIQIVYSGGSYMGNDPDGFEVAPVRRFLNERGMTVVTLKYRTPRPVGLQKHVTAWQDLQRTIRVVRSEAASRGLDPDRIGIMGSSAGGHLTLMGATSSLHQSYLGTDAIDGLSCSPQWAVAVYPAYALTDGAEGENVAGGNADEARLVPEFSFDLKTCPTLFLHGDADGWAAMNSVKCWEQMRRMGVQGEVHTIAKVGHCFQRKARPGTGSHDWLERIWDFLLRKGFVERSAGPRHGFGDLTLSSGTRVRECVYQTRQDHTPVIMAGAKDFVSVQDRARPRMEFGHPVYILPTDSYDDLLETVRTLYERYGFEPRIDAIGSACVAAGKVWKELGREARVGQTFAFDVPEGFTSDDLAYENVKVHASKAFARRTVKPAGIVRNAAGNWLVDFGKDAFGWAEARSAVPVRGWAGEKLTSGRSVMAQQPDAHIRSAPVSGGGADSWTRLRFHVTIVSRAAALSIPPELGEVMPMRYVEFSGDGAFVPTAENVRMVALEYPYDESECGFSSSNGDLDRVYDFCTYTLRATTFGGLYIDGDRERLPYEADAYVTQLSNYAMSSDYEVSRLTHDHLMPYATWPTEYRQISVLMAWSYWMWSGETDLLGKHYARLKDEKLMERYRRESDGLLETGGAMNRGAYEGAADIADWPPPERFGFEFRKANAIVNAYYYIGLNQMAQIADRLGKSADATAFATKAKRVYDSYQKAFWDEARGVYVDGQGATHASIQANALAVVAGLVPEERIRRVGGWLASREMECSVYMAQHFLEALFKTGHGARAVALMTADNDRSWIGMLKGGATMTKEVWNDDVYPGIDWNHSWGTAALNVIARCLAGVTPMEPGFGKIRIAPDPAGLERFETKVPTARGVVSLRYAKEGPRERLEVHAPAEAVVTFRGQTKSVGKGEHVFE